MLRKESAFFGPYLRDLPATLDHPLVRQVCPPLLLDHADEAQAAIHTSSPG
jgi:hypothetical protein